MITDHLFFIIVPIAGAGLALLINGIRQMPTQINVKRYIIIAVLSAVPFYLGDWYIYQKASFSSEIISGNKREAFSFIYFVVYIWVVPRIIDRNMSDNN